MSVSRRQFLQTLTALLGLPAISAIAAPDKELTAWVAKEEAKDPSFDLDKTDNPLFLYARLFGQTFILNGDLELETETFKPEYSGSGFIEIRSPYRHTTLTINSSDKDFHKTIARLFESDWNENNVEIGFISSKGEPKKFMDLHGVQLIDVATTIGSELPALGVTGLGVTRACLRYGFVKVDPTKFREIAL